MPAADMSKAQVDAHLARMAYERGVDPLDYAAELAQFKLETFVKCHDMVRAMPEHFPDGSPAAAPFARALIEALLGAGWTPPWAPKRPQRPPGPSRGPDGVQGPGTPIRPS